MPFSYYLFGAVYVCKEEKVAYRTYPEVSGFPSFFGDLICHLSSSVLKCTKFSLFPFHSNEWYIFSMKVLMLDWQQQKRQWALCVCEKGCTLHNSQSWKVWTCIYPSMIKIWCVISSELFHFTHEKLWCVLAVVIIFVIWHFVQWLSSVVVFCFL